MIDRLLFYQLSADLFTPAVQLASFVHEAGDALVTLTTLHLCIKEASSGRTSATLIESLVLLVGACPALKSLISRGFLWPAVLLKLGDVCPFISTLSIHIEDRSLAGLHEALEQLPSFLPQLTSLALPFCVSENYFSHLQGHNGLLSLGLDSVTFDDESQWLRLPPRLQHLKCDEINTGPPSFHDGRQVMASLVTFSMQTPTLSLTALVQLLRSAPELKVIREENYYHPTDNGKFNITCHVTSQSTPTDMLLLHQRMLAGLEVEGCIMHVHGGKEEPASLLQPLADPWPCMTYVKTCAFSSIGHAWLIQLVKVFPNVTRLGLNDLEAMDDAALQTVAACADLNQLDLESCNKIGPKGLVFLCKKLPLLRLVRCSDCPKLKSSVLKRCVKALLKHGPEVEMVNVD